MNTRFYRANGLDARRLAQGLSSLFYADGYQVQQLTQNNQIVLQLRKGGEFEAVLGIQAALAVTLQTVPGGMIAIVGQQQWVDKAAAGVLGLMLLWPLAITAGAGAIRQASLEGEIFQALDSVAFQHYPDVQIGPVPINLEEQAQQHFYQNQAPFQTNPHQAPPAGRRPYYTAPAQRPEAHYTPPPQRPEPQYVPPIPTPPQKPPVPKAEEEIIRLPGQGQKQCRNCQEVNEIDDTYCSHCGKSLNEEAATQYCKNCHAILKKGAAFCTKCATPTSISDVGK